jgi:hypothetical protein
MCTPSTGIVFFKDKQEECHLLARLNHQEQRGFYLIWRFSKLDRSIFGRLPMNIGRLPDMISASS